LAAPGFSQESASGPAEELTGTLKKVRDTGVVILGYRESSIPFSYLNERGRPIGYSIDLGRAIAQSIADELGRPLADPNVNEADDNMVTIKFVPVTSDTRMAAVTTGQVDLECGSTTNNIERQKTVAFSPVMFVSGTKLMVKKGAPIQSFHDLVGKTVVVTAGTTNEQTMHNLVQQFGLQLNLVTARDHEESYQQVATGNADAFAGDDVLLFGLIAKHHSEDQLVIVGDFLSYDPYSIMYRKDDPPLTAVVNATFQQLAQSGELEYLYKKWFMRKLPSGETLNLPMSEQLQKALQVIGMRVEGRSD
jgi:ABC-type amino acid transport substrate-binding protein